MQQPFDDSLKDVASSMGISVYQQFTLMEASLFLRSPVSELEKLVKNNQIAFIQLNKNDIQFFGYQLLEHLLNCVVDSTNQFKNTSPSDDDNRILRAKEVQRLVGLSRTTLWRLERKGTFPQRLPLGTGSVGWLKSDIEAWLHSRKP